MLQNKRFYCPFNGSLTFLYVESTESCVDNQVAVVGGGVAGLVPKHHSLKLGLMLYFWRPLTIQLVAE